MERSHNRLRPFFRHPHRVAVPICLSHGFLGGLRAEATHPDQLDAVVIEYLRQNGYGPLFRTGTIQIDGMSEKTYTYRVRTKITKRYVILRNGTIEILSIASDPCELVIAAYPYARGEPLSQAEEAAADAIVQSLTFQQPANFLNVNARDDGIIEVSFDPDYRRPVYPPGNHPPLPVYPAQNHLSQKLLPNDPNHPVYRVIGAFIFFIIVGLLAWRGCDNPNAQQGVQPDPNAPREERPK